MMKNREQEKHLVTDDPAPEPQILGSAVCRTPTEFVAYRLSIGNPNYAIQKKNNSIKDEWFFFNSLQDSVAYALDWNNLGCKVEQFEEKQEDGSYEYGYCVRGLNNPEVNSIFYQNWIWQAATGDVQDVNRAATHDVLTRLRQELFKCAAEFHLDGIELIVLDFSRCEGESEFLRDWEDELSNFS